ncbi:hypothetical protein [Actinoplanes sp. HUAS TT8]|uniref:hypothetical protein n=1 Tax=Actinoplanes sp. HUAS TT8 TaxID=3447453 RepID=UPI003F5225EB
MSDLLPFLPPALLALFGSARAVMYAWYLRKLWRELSAEPAGRTVEITLVWGSPPTLTMRRLPSPESRP